MNRIAAIFAFAAAFSLATAAAAPLYARGGFHRITRCTSVNSADYSV